MTKVKAAFLKETCRHQTIDVLILNEANRNAQDLPPTSIKSSKVKIKGYNCYVDVAGRQNVYVRKALAQRRVDDRRMVSGMILRVEEMHIYALYSHPLRAKNRETVADIGQEIIDL